MDTEEESKVVKLLRTVAGIDSIHKVATFEGPAATNRGAIALSQSHS